MAMYRVKYFYLATGMEGRADERDYGLREANTPEEAIESVVLEEFPEDKMYGPNNAYSSRHFFRVCLSAELMPNAPHEGPGAALSRTVPLDAVVGRQRKDT